MCDTGSGPGMSSGVRTLQIQRCIEANPILAGAGQAAVCCPTVRAATTPAPAVSQRLWQRFHECPLRTAGQTTTVTTTHRNYVGGLDHAAVTVRGTPAALRTSRLKDAAEEAGRSRYGAFFRPPARLPPCPLPPMPQAGVPIARITPCNPATQTVDYSDPRA